jgi:hypothetical protein
VTALTTTDSAAIGERAFIAHQRIIQKVCALQKSWIELGEELYHFTRQKFYLEMGHPTIRSYLADPQVGIGATMGFMTMAVYERYIIEAKLSGSTVELVEAGVRKLYKARKHVDAENALEVVQNAAALSETDLIAWLDGTEPLDDLDPDTELCPLCHGTGRVPRARK